jgi:SAM-dependent methyltransferase
MSQAPVNQSQIELWNGPGAERWVSEQERLDRSFAPIDAIGMARAGARPGERVIDLGCGCGGSTLQLADAVGAAGAVLGVDISAPMLARARERGGARPWITWLQADAALHPFSGDADLLYSRFGAMFFEAPAAAFANLQRALRPSGRLCLICWRSPEENPWYGVPMRAALSVLPPPAPSAPDAPGPFAFAARERVSAILAAAGFAHIEFDAQDTALCISTTGLADAVDFALQAGPVARLLAGTDRDTVASVQGAIAAALASYASQERVALPAGVWIVTARASQ